MDNMKMDNLNKFSYCWTKDIMDKWTSWTTVHLGQMYINDKSLDNLEQLNILEELTSQTKDKLASWTILMDLFLYWTNGHVGQILTFQ